MQTLSFPFDVTLSSFGVLGPAARTGIVSNDPSATVANFLAPAANAVDQNLIGFAQGAIVPMQLIFPLLQGEKVLVSVSGACTAVITYDAV